MLRKCLQFFFFFFKPELAELVIHSCPENIAYKAFKKYFKNFSKSLQNIWGEIQSHYSCRSAAYAVLVATMRTFLKIMFTILWNFIISCNAPKSRFCLLSDLQPACSFWDGIASGTISSILSTFESYTWMSSILLRLWVWLCNLIRNDFLYRKIPTVLFTRKFE